MASTLSHAERAAVAASLTPERAHARGRLGSGLARPRLLAFLDRPRDPDHLFADGRARLFSAARPYAVSPVHGAPAGSSVAPRHPGNRGFLGLARAGSLGVHRGGAGFAPRSK